MVARHNVDTEAIVREGIDIDLVDQAHVRDLVSKCAHVRGQVVLKSARIHEKENSR
jgi:hypothetical protein